MHRIRLDNAEFEGNNSVYLFTGGRIVLVDTGISMPDVRAQIEDHLDRHGVAVADLDEILVTHWHVDHSGLAGGFQAESGATVRAHPLDEALVARDPEAEADLDATRDRKLAEWGVPSASKEELLAFLEANEGTRGEQADVTPLADGGTVRAGDETLRAVHTPGHTAGHLCFVREDHTTSADAASDAPAARTVLTGDALLPEYTPNVGGADPRVEGALGRYIDTLDWLATAGFDRAYPAHRDPIEDPAARARTIVQHHEARAGRILGYLLECGPADPWTVSAHLFGDLAGIHIVHGPGEAYVHLEHMVRHGMLERTGEEYAVEDPAADLGALFPG